MFFFENFHIKINFYLFSIEEFLLIIFLFSLSKLIILCIIIELIWPTHFFNKRFNINFQAFKFREFNAILLKLRSYSKIKFFLKKIWFFYVYKC